MNISSLNYHLSMIQTKAENSSTLCKFHKGRKALRPMESNADRLSLYSFSLFLKMALLFLKIVFNGKELQVFSQFVVNKKLFLHYHHHHHNKHLPQFTWLNNVFEIQGMCPYA